MIPEAILNQIQDRVDIVEMIGARIPLKRAGRNFKACCPFHHEKTPSFMVSSGKQIFHCFGCGAGGNVFSFLMKFDKRDFREVVESLAETVGVEIPNDRLQKEGSDRTAVYYLANTMAGDFYHQTLLKSPSAEGARIYLSGRGVGAETIEAFKLGYAPDTWDALYNALNGKIPDAILEKAGLVIARKEAGYYDRFRRRVIFPITDSKGVCIALGGRVMDDSLPKYLNSPETEVYSKGRNLYGLSQAKQAIREREFAVVVEGYMDLITCHQAGVRNVVASLGTAVTIEQARLLKRQSPRVVILYDADKAGEMATLRGLEIFLLEGMDIKIAKLPEGHDPDSFIREQGLERFQECLNRSVSIFEYKLAKLKECHEVGSLEGKVKIASEMVSLFTKAQSEILKSAWTKALAAELNLAEDALVAEMKKGTQAAFSRASQNQRPVRTPPTEDVLPAERLLIGLLMDNADFQSRAKALLTADNFDNVWVRKIAEHIMAQNGELFSPKNFMNFYPDNPAMSGLISRAIAEAENAVDKDKAFSDCLAHLRRRKLRIQREELLDKIREAERLGDQGGISQCISDLHELNKKEKSIHEKK